MAGVAILTCQQNSHPFQERRISLAEPIKIGRSVARARPATNNGIFDCKVLSRNHAMLWYDNNKFYIQDTKSSNGTFINSQRLCKGGEESPAREVFSEDQIQFGVDVMENNRRGEKITHGCIIATLTLFHADGREAKNIYSDSGLMSTLSPGLSVQSQDLYQLAQYLQEAIHREKMLEQKLTTLQQLVNNTQEASETGWQALITEDRLLSRLDVLENQLHIYSKNHAEDALKQEVVTLQEEKNTYETTAKESLRKVLQEKLDAVRKLSDLEKSLLNTEEECSHLKDMCEKSQEELQVLAEKYQDQLKEVQELQDKLVEAERNHKHESEKINAEKQDLQDKLDVMVKEEQVLQAKVESLQADNDITTNQLAAIKAKLEALKEEPTDNEDDDKKTDEEKEEDQEKEDKEDIKQDDNKIEDDNKLVDSLTSDIQSEIIPTFPKDMKFEDLEVKLKETQQQIEKYRLQIDDSDAKLRESQDKVDYLQSELEKAELESRQYVSKICTLEESLRLSDMHMNHMMENTMADLKQQLKESHKQSDGSNELIKGLKEKVSSLEKDVSDYKVPESERADVTLVDSSFNINSADTTMTNHVDSIFDDDENLKELLQEAKSLQKKAEIELMKSKVDLDETKVRADKSEDVANNFREQLTETQQIVKDQSDAVISLQGQLEQEKTKHKDTKKELEDSKRAQQEAQQTAKQSHNEAENLKTEFAALKEECSGLRKRIQAIEAEMKMSRKENLQLSAEYNKLQESYRQLEALKFQLENNEQTLKTSLIDSGKEKQQAIQELAHAKDELLCTNEQRESSLNKIAELNSEMSTMGEKYKQLCERSKMLSFCSSIPLLMLLFGILMALYPSLAQLTATT